MFQAKKYNLRIAVLKGCFLERKKRTPFFPPDSYILCQWKSFLFEDLRERTMEFKAVGVGEPVEYPEPFMLPHSLWVESGPLV